MRSKIITVGIMDQGRLAGNDPTCAGCQLTGARLLYWGPTVRNLGNPKSEKRFSGDICLSLSSFTGVLLI